MTPEQEAVARQSAIPITAADAQYVIDARASVKRLNGEVLAAIDRRAYTTADRLDRDRTNLERGIASRLGRPRPKS